MSVGLNQMIFAAFGVGDLEHTDRDLAGNGKLALGIEFEIRPRAAAEFEDPRVFGKKLDDLLPPAAKAEPFERSEGSIIVRGELVVDGRHFEILPHKRAGFRISVYNLEFYGTNDRYGEERFGPDLRR